MSQDPESLAAVTFIICAVGVLSPILISLPPLYIFPQEVLARIRNSVEFDTEV